MIPAWPRSHWSSTPGVNPVCNKSYLPDSSFLPVLQVSTKCDISDPAMISVSFQYPKCQPSVTYKWWEPDPDRIPVLHWFQPRVILVILPWSQSHSSTQMLSQCDISDLNLIPVSFQLYSRCQHSVIPASSDPGLVPAQVSRCQPSVL